MGVRLGRGGEEFGRDLRGGGRGGEGKEHGGDFDDGEVILFKDGGNIVSKEFYVVFGEGNSCLYTSCYHCL